MTGGGVPAVSAAPPAPQGGHRVPGNLQGIAIDLPLLFAAKAGVGLYVLLAGFTHVSDDDYARVVIAEQFAHHPALDPSGTSWLPFPFWLTGAAMLALGRTLVAARTVAYAVGVVSVAAPYVAMRVAGCRRGTALAGTLVALALPWSAWLGVATVPEAMTACLVAAAAIGVTCEQAGIACAAALLAASLSRYEAWPVCVVFAVASLPKSGQAPRRIIAVSALALAGPVGWMVWNLHAHGSALHFVARVAAYRQAIGAVPASLAEKLTAFPLALASSAPALLALAALGAIALPFDATLRRRWTPALASAAAILVFLVYGDLRDGAPTHHPERALLPIWWILATFAADALRTLARLVAWGRPRRESGIVGLTFAGALAWLALLPAQLRDAPGMRDDESRRAQIARASQLPPGEGWTVTPCAYEHFALIAAEGEPERFTVLPATHTAVTPSCPAVEAR